MSSLFRDACYIDHVAIFKSPQRNIRLQGSSIDWSYYRKQTVLMIYLCGSNKIVLKKRLATATTKQDRYLSQIILVERHANVGRDSLPAAAHQL